MDDARLAFQSIPDERAISAMPVVVQYVARIGEVQLKKKSDEFVFVIYPDARDGDSFHCEEVPQDPFAIRDRFQKITTPSGALEFLSTTGQFSPVHSRITWSEFQRWQRFAYLVTEHSELARTMHEGVWTGECGEALKALTGIYESSFFAIPALSETESEIASRLRFQELLNQDADLRKSVQEGANLSKRRHRELCTWFRQPSSKACSVEWIPNSEELDDNTLLRKLQAGGAMIEYLVPRHRLRPVYLIRPIYTLEAIAGAIYADRCNAVEYRACAHCKQLFPVGAHKEKKYCDQARCKNTAHQQRRRANAKARLAAKKSHSSERNQKGGK